MDDSFDDWDAWIDAALAADPLPALDDEEELPTEPLPSENELAAAQESLSQWKSPEEFYRITVGLCARSPGPEFFNRAQFKFLREAYVLGKFAKRQRAEAVRLVAPSERWPDGLIRLEGRDHGIEVTSTHGGRKLGKEYRQPKVLTHDPVENWIARAASIPRYLDNAVAQKAGKGYPPCWLVVYLNIGEYGISQKETERAIAEVKCRYAASFTAISVLWNGKLH
jgi:hypothetical protein